VRKLQILFDDEEILGFSRTNKINGKMGNKQ